VIRNLLLTTGRERDIVDKSLLARRLRLSGLVKRMGSTRQLILELQGPEATRSLGRKIGRLVQGGEILALFGELGTGKTTFVQGLAAGLGLAPENVSSPTFVIISNLTGGRLSLNHVDLYRLDLDEAAELGLEEMMTGVDSETQITVIEWADRALELIPSDRLEIHFSWAETQLRKALILAWGPMAETILESFGRLTWTGNQDNWERSDKWA
jgi:tRNA threonylcarbamoyladenosine biosynthesis protein TsaE